MHTSPCTYIHNHNSLLCIKNAKTVEKFLTLLGTRGFITLFRRFCSLCLILSQLNTIYNLIPCFFEVGTEFTNILCFKELKGNFVSSMADSPYKRGC